MTGRSRRGVKFPHNNKHSNGHSEGRRSSFSDVSEEGSPSKPKSAGTLENIDEVCRPAHAACPVVVLHG
jgi:phosphatidate cytidylyltransferase